jgi:hypothetical protein
MVPPVEDSTPPSATLPIVRPMSRRDYQISLIEARGPNSRGVQLLRAGLAAIGKTYVLVSVMTPIASPLLNAQGAGLNMSPPLHGSTLPSKTSRVTRPLATREHKIMHTESRGPNSSLLHAVVADVAKTPPLQPSQPTVSLPLEASKHSQYIDGQFFRLYPKYARS